MKQCLKSFHCGEPFTEGFGVDYIPSQNTFQDILSMSESSQILRKLAEKLEDPSLCLRMSWKDGDVAIIDNLAVAHYAHPDTQKSPESHGLR